VRFYLTIFKRWHPDKHKEEDRERATEEFKVISEAYSVLSNEKRRAYYDKHGTVEGVDDAADAQEFMDEVFTMFFSAGDMHSPFSDFDEFIKILEGDNDKRTRKMFRDLGKGYRPKGGRTGLAARQK
jgi:DnaJ-class molecular chaperone